MSAYSQYEKISLREARAAFADPFRTPVSALVHAVNDEAPAARNKVKHGLSGMARVFQRALDLGIGVVFRTLDRRAAYRGFREDGLRVGAPNDVARLDLWEVDEVAERLQPRYLAASAALGVVAGSLGKLGALLDAPLVALLAARSIGDYALHYGFDPSAPAERRFARDVFVAALTPAKSIRAASIDELVTAATAGARAWRRREVGLGAPMLLRLAQRVLARGLSHGEKKSLARLGGVAAAAINAWLLFGVMRAARSAYRERFLARRSSASGHDDFRLMRRIATQRSIEK